MSRSAVLSRREVDTSIIEGCQRGDPEAMRALWLEYKDRVYSIALHFFRDDHALAQDITQDVFIKLFARLRQFRHDAEFTTWLYRLVANACMDEQRRRKRWSFFGDAMSELAFSSAASTEIPVDELIVHREIGEEVKAAVASLTPKLRIVILLRYFDDLAYEEMAAALECSPGTVASRLNRAHQSLARKLGHLRGSVLS
jgi:RNA polymerase sigma-70 factor, ECF subfamily